MEVVIDASAVMAVVFSEPEREAVLVATRDAVLLAPGSLPWEVGNAVVRAVRRRRISADQAMASLSAFQSVPIRDERGRRHRGPAMGGFVKTFTYSEARQRLGAVLDEACREGGVRIRRQDGSTFIVQPLETPTSPLDVPGVKANFRPGELVKMLRDERRRSADRILDNFSSLRPKARKKTAASTDSPPSRRKSRKS